MLARYLYFCILSFSIMLSAMNESDNESDSDNSRVLPQIFLIVGPPCAGKTTLAFFLKKSLQPIESYDVVSHSYFREKNLLSYAKAYNVASYGYQTTNMHSLCNDARLLIASQENIRTQNRLRGLWRMACQECDNAFYKHILERAEKGHPLIIDATLDNDKKWRNHMSRLHPYTMLSVFTDIDQEVLQERVHKLNVTKGSKKYSALRDINRVLATYPIYYNFRTLKPAYKTDLIVNTGKLTPPEAAQQIIDYIANN